MKKHLDEWGEPVWYPVTHDLDRIQKFPNRCDSTVTRLGEEDACNKTAVAAITMFWEGEWSTWPVCAYHAHMMGGKSNAELVPLSALVGGW